MKFESIEVENTSSGFNSPNKKKKGLQKQNNKEQKFFENNENFNHKLMNQDDQNLYKRAY